MGKATTQKAISLTNLARFKGKCDDHYKVYRHSLQLEILGDNYLFFSIESSSPTPITNFQKLTDALAYTLSSDNYLGMGGGYYNDSIGCVYAITQIGLILRVTPAKLSIEYYLGGDESARDEFAQSDISHYYDNVVEA